MYKAYGLYKTVFVFDKFVIKVPRLYKNLMDSIRSVFACYTEIYNGIFSKKEEKKYLLPLYSPIILPVIIQPKVKVLEDTSISIMANDLAHDFCIRTESEFGESCGKFGDIKADNLGYWKGRLVKIDYDSIYCIHNLIISIRNKFKSK